MRLPAGSAPFWAGADPAASSLQITAVVAAVAHQVAAHDPEVAGHPWLRAATGYCFRAIEALEAAPPAMALAFAVRMLDAASDAEPRAVDLLERLGAFVPRDGTLHVAGGAEDEFMRPLDFAPLPGPARGLISPEAVAADLDRLAGGQREDGGWTVDFASYSPAATLEWRGYATVRAVALLRANGRL